MDSSRNMPNRKEIESHCTYTFWIHLFICLCVFFLFEMQGSIAQSIDDHWSKNIQRCFIIAKFANRQQRNNMHWRAGIPRVSRTRNIVSLKTHTFYGRVWSFFRFHTHKKKKQKVWQRILGCVRSNNYFNQKNLT